MAAPINLYLDQVKVNKSGSLLWLLLYSLGLPACYFGVVHSHLPLWERVFIGMMGVVSVPAILSCANQLYKSSTVKPVVEFSDMGIWLRGGWGDNWMLPWSQIELFSPPLDLFEKNLKGEIGIAQKLSDRLYFLLSAPSIKKRYLPSNYRHSKFKNYFEVGGHFQSLSEGEQQDLLKLLSTKVRKFDLICWEG